LLEAALKQHRAGKLKAACETYRKILKRAPRHADALHLLGLATLELGRPGHAAQLFVKAAAVSPEEPLYRLYLGEAQRAAGKPEEAAAAFRAALAIDPGYVPALASLGNILKAQGNFSEAVACHERAAALAPASAEVRSNLASALHDAGKIGAALQAARDSARLSPDHPEIRFNLGNILLAAGNFEEAEGAFAFTCAKNPHHVRAWCNRGVALREMGQGGAAVESLRRALALVPDWADAHWNLGLALLMKGDLAEGWREYEWRKRIPGFAMPKAPGPGAWGPAWDGTPLSGRRLLLRAEQGLGDTIQFARYARLAAQGGGSVVLECPPALVRLLSRADLCESIVAGGEAAEFDVEAPLMSAPHFLDPELRAAGGLVPYLCAEPELVATWRARLEARPGFRIGICWQGNPAYRADARRSIPLAQFCALARIPGVRLVSLQKGHGTEQLATVPPGTVEDLSGDFDENTGAFVDTAAVMANLDLAVCSDTAAAHLAGAMGVPVWLALTHAPDWRWGSSGETTPWYPAMRLFRQETAGDWSGVFARIAAALGERLAKG
jgi:tetratricopeptide (TPR) repeat protein